VCEVLNLQGGVVVVVAVLSASVKRGREPYREYTGERLGDARIVVIIIVAHTLFGLNPQTHHD
jgi:hypothetical protein